MYRSYRYAYRYTYQYGGTNKKREERRLSVRNGVRDACEAFLTPRTLPNRLWAIISSQSGHALVKGPLLVAYHGQYEYIVLLYCRPQLLVASNMAVREMGRSPQGYPKTLTPPK